MTVVVEKAQLLKMIADLQTRVEKLEEDVFYLRACGSWGDKSWEHFKKTWKPTWENNKDFNLEGK